MMPRTTRSVILAGICLFAALCFTPALRAENQPGNKPREGGGGPAFMIDQLKATLAELKLTDEQKSKVDLVLSSILEEIDKLKGDLQNATPEERQKKITEFRKGIFDKLNEILNDEQKQALREKMMQLRGGGGAGGAGAGAMRLKQAIDKLDLSADQKAKVETILGDVKKKMEELRAQAQTGDKSQMREKFMAIQKELMQQLQEVLTPDQQQALREQMQAGRGDHPGQGGGAAPKGDK